MHPEEYNDFQYYFGCIKLFSSAQNLIPVLHQGAFPPVSAGVFILNDLDLHLPTGNSTVVYVITCAQTYLLLSDTLAMMNYFCK